MAPTGTWNDFMQDSRSKSRIDHIFVTRDFDVPHYAIFTNSYWLGKSRRNISDHYPVMVKLSYSKNKTLQKVISISFYSEVSEIERNTILVGYTITSYTTKEQLTLLFILSTEHHWR